MLRMKRGIEKFSSVSMPRFPYLTYGYSSHAREAINTEKY
jgi:hypothetical protein